MDTTGQLERRPASERCTKLRKSALASAAHSEQQHVAFKEVIDVGKLLGINMHRKYTPAPPKPLLVRDEFRVVINCSRASEDNIG